MQAEERILSYNWDDYDTMHVVIKPAQMTPEELYRGFKWAYRETFRLHRVVKRVSRPDIRCAINFVGNLCYRIFVKRLYSEPRFATPYSMHDPGEPACRQALGGAGGRGGGGVRRLTLIYPAIGRKPGKPFVRSWQLQPLAIARLAAMTPPDWQITFFDDRLEPIDYGIATDLVALSIETYSSKRGYHIAARFRQRGVPVVLGGYHATLCPEEAKQHADAVCVGEAESVWRNSAGAERGQLKPFYQGDRSRPLQGLQPDRSIFRGKNYLPVALVETSRGCPFQCNFCSIGAVFQGTYRRRPVEEVVANCARFTTNTSFSWTIISSVTRLAPANCSKPLRPLESSG